MITNFINFTSVLCPFKCSDNQCVMVKINVSRGDKLAADC